MGKSQCLKKPEWRNEGQQTEPLYFAGFKKLIEENPIYKDMVLIEIESCQAETMRVISMAEDYLLVNEIGNNVVHHYG